MAPADRNYLSFWVAIWVATILVQIGLTRWIVITIRALKEHS